MDAQLIAQFTDEERRAAVDIGSIRGELQERVRELFKTLGDPLLSAQDVAELLGDLPESDVAAALGGLVGVGVLESSSNTQRPLDERATQLYRLRDVPVQRLKI